MLCLFYTGSRGAYILGVISQYLSQNKNEYLSHSEMAQFGLILCLYS